MRIRLKICCIASPEAAALAVAAVRPFGVDVCSGLRSNGMLDAEKARAFTRAIWG